ncbi:hypothetical protein [Streptomyces sp. NPDC088739]|uniref:hypothetical protein n=1 Tax=Streptomyces sp. NPDC088739 TaxID=3365882 RepID=UPI00382A5E3C
MNHDDITPRFLDRLAQDVAAILDGRDLDGDPEPTDAGVRLGVALRFHADTRDFLVTWDATFPGCARLAVGRDVAAWLVPLAEGAGITTYENQRFLLSEEQAHALADAVENRAGA